MELHCIAARSGKLSSFLQRELRCSSSFIHKTKWLQCFYVNGVPQRTNYIVSPGDEIRVPIVEPTPDYPAEAGPLDILYEDEHILLVNKPAGLVVHEDESQTPNTLINQIKAYLFQSGAWDPESERSFVPALCNRIDRNTGGIVLAAKTAPALRILNEKIRDREIAKYYLCLVHGTPKPASGTLKNYLRRDTDKKQVFVDRSKTKDNLTALLRYQVKESRCGLSLVECELLTGRTHQIRVQMAQAGHPLAGDTKYGTAGQNRGLPFSHQALWSWRVRFDFPTPAGELEYLRGLEVQVAHVPFLDFFRSLPKK